MKPISLTFNHLDFIVNPFHTAGMDGKPTMIDNTVCILLQSSGKGYDGLYENILKIFLEKYP
jgi:hypothetical protein